MWERLRWAAENPPFDAPFRASRRAAALPIFREMTSHSGEGVAADRFQAVLESIPGLVVYLDLVQPDNPAESPDAVAGRLMNIVWIGAGHLLDGAAWHPPTVPA